MGVVIRMDSKKFLKDFRKEVDTSEYQYVLISELIKTRGEHKNVQAIQRLIPPPAIISEYINGDKQSYKKAYLKYLQTPDIDAMVTIIVKAAIQNDMKIVLLCSRSEDEFAYLKHLSEYMEAVYKLKTFTYKDYTKDPEKASKIKNKDEINKIVSKKLERMGKDGVDLNTVNNKDRYIKELKKLGKKGMKKLAKSRGIKIKDDLEKDEMAKKLAKKLLA
jgi:hypothetical protein